LDVAGESKLKKKKAVRRKRKGRVCAVENKKLLEKKVETETGGPWKGSNEPLANSSRKKTSKKRAKGTAQERWDEGPVAYRRGGHEPKGNVRGWRGNGVGTGGCKIRRKGQRLQPGENSLGVRAVKE